MASHYKVRRHLNVGISSRQMIVQMATSWTGKCFQLTNMQAFHLLILQSWTCLFLSSLCRCWFETFFSAKHEQMVEFRIRYLWRKSVFCYWNQLCTLSYLSAIWKPCCSFQSLFSWELNSNFRDKFRRRKRETGFPGHQYLFILEC